MQLRDLPEAVQQNLQDGVVVSSEQEALRTIESYQEQIDADRERAQQVADKSTAGTETSHDKPAGPANTEGQPAEPSDEKDKSDEGGE